MSKNRNRAKLNKALSNNEYNRIQLKELYPPWDEYDWTWHHGNMPNHKWRSYKTWKHNRKTKYKQKEMTHSIVKRKR
jgi:hypothetical protein